MKKIVILLVLFNLFVGCSKLLMEKPPQNTPKENFNSLWNTLNEKYSYFELKGIDWQKIKIKYEPFIKEDMDSFELFSVFSGMLNELRDGHVNLYAGFNISRNWEWFLNYPDNFDYNVIERYYLRSNHYISGGLRYSFLRSKNRKGYVIYVYYSSFSNSANYIELLSSLTKAEDCKGLIFDVRSNGGGSVYNAHKLAHTFANEKKLVIKEYYKSGKGHNEFLKSKDFYLEPNNTISKPIVVLTNRRCFSATSFFCGMIKTIPNVTVVGDTTGGGAGLPIFYELPNKWRYRFSTTKTEYLDIDGNYKDFEFGVSPHIVLPEIPKDTLKKGVDTWINYAFDKIIGK